MQQLLVFGLRRKLAEQIGEGAAEQVSAGADGLAEGPPNLGAG